MNTRRFVFVALVISLLVILTSGASAAPHLVGCTAGGVYDPVCDVNHDGIVDIQDIQLTSGHWNQTGTWLSDNNHDHLGQTWTGSNNTLTITGAFSPNPPLLLANTTGDGLRATTSATNGTGVEGTATASSGTTTGVAGKSFSIGGVGVSGTAYAASGSSYGVVGQSSSTTGRGVWGVASAVSGINAGVYGQSVSTDGAGVRGYATAASGVTYGVYGEASSPDGRAVYGYATSGSGTSTAVYGKALSTAGSGVIGWAAAASGNTVGVWGIVNSPTGKGVDGYAAATSGQSYGVYGQSSSPAGYAVYGINDAASSGGVGVYGHSLNGVAIHANGNGASTTALQISNGALRVTGAGLNSSTPVFQHQVNHSGANANTCTDGTFGFWYSYLNHPLLNNHPEALLIVTSNSDDLIVRYSPIGCPAGRWTVTKPGINLPTDGSLVNVLVVLP